VLAEEVIVGFVREVSIEFWHGNVVEGFQMEEQGDGNLIFRWDISKQL
jgi:hypothetical protein